MTGYGVNDAPALKAADIGCTMGVSQPPLAGASPPVAAAPPPSAKYYKGR